MLKIIFATFILSSFSAYAQTETAFNSNAEVVGYNTLKKGNLEFIFQYEKARIGGCNSPSNLRACKEEWVKKTSCEVTPEGNIAKIDIQNIQDCGNKQNICQFLVRKGVKINVSEICQGQPVTGIVINGISEKLK